MLSDISTPHPGLACPKHALALKKQDNWLTCPEGCKFEVVGNIARFVAADNYAAAFGLQWNQYRTTQLDSQTGLTISTDRLRRLLGGSFDVVAGKQVLEAGCGAGRFSELLLGAKAHLCAIDLSSAVEANYKNCSRFPNYTVSQASILALPYAPGQFDVVVCIGVIQHTPDPEQTMTALCKQVKPGGLLVIDHYTQGYPATLSRRLIRSALLRLPGRWPLLVCRALTAVLWPLHRFFWWGRSMPVLRGLRPLFLRASPVVDYHADYPQLGPALLKVWATLDTHDTLTDYYKHLRSADQIRTHLKACGMHDIEAYYAGNGVEARARKPLMPANQQGLS